MELVETRGADEYPVEEEWAPFENFLLLAPQWHGVKSPLLKRPLSELVELLLRLTVLYRLNIPLASHVELKRP